MYSKTLFWLHSFSLSGASLICLSLVFVEIPSFHSIKSTMTEICQSFKKRGTCKFGESCRFSHEEHRKPCWYFTTTQGCRFGEKCRDLHDPTLSHLHVLPDAKRNQSPTSISSLASYRYGDNDINSRLSDTVSRMPTLDIPLSVAERVVESITVKTKGTALRIVHTSDTHNHLSTKSSFYIPPGDVLIHSGDFSNKGTHSEFKAFNCWLEKWMHKFPVRIVIFGNHDLKAERGNISVLKSCLPAATHVLCHESLQINGINFYGSPWLYYQDGLYNNRSEVMPAHRFDEIPSGTHVVLTHGPAKNLHDHLHLESRMGSEHLLDALARVDALVHMCGHIHESYGHTILNKRYDHMHAEDIFSDSSSIFMRVHYGFKDLTATCLRLVGVNARQWITQRRQYISMNSSACGQKSSAGLLNPAQILDIWLDSDGEVRFKLINKSNSTAVSQGGLQYDLTVMVAAGLVCIVVFFSSLFQSE